MAQHPRPVGPAFQNTGAPFSPEMTPFVGPDRGLRYSSLNRSGWQTAQTTHVQATFSVEMIQGSVPAQARNFTRPRVGWSDSQVSPVAAPFSVDMTLAARPDRPRPYLPSMPGLPATPDVPVFSSEMVIGWHADQPRLFSTRNHLGQQVFPVTHVPAPFGLEMLEASRPFAPRIFVPAKQGWSTAQLTHVAAPFSQEMITALRPETARLFRARFPHLPENVFIDTFSIEMVAGWHPDSPRLFIARAPHLPNVVQIFVFSSEMTVGWKPDQPRLFDTRNRRGWQVTQTTHGAAPFSVEMVQGATPPRLIKLIQNQGLTILSLQPVLGFQAAWATQANRFVSPMDDLIVEDKVTS